MEIFNVKNLTFSFLESKKEVLKDVTFSIQQGEFVVICGESGSGKSTLLKMLKREISPYGEKRGEILYKGQKLEDLDARVSATEIGYVMQRPDDQIVMDKVWHELAFGLENLGIPTPIIRRKIGEMANFFAIQHWFHAKTTDLSGGQKQLLNLAAIMVMQPSILILDEPTSQLDPIAATEFIHTLEKLNKNFGLTIVIVEHRLEEILSVATKVILLEEGKIRFSDQPRKIGEKLQHHKMAFALPSATRIFYGLGEQGESPLTVKEGIQYLSDYYKGERQSNFLPTTNQKENTNEIVLALKNVWFRYERDLPDILAGVDFQVNKGEIVSILGGNGSGKTTLLNVISGQRKAYRGNVFINGKKITKYKGKELYRQNVAFLPQDSQTVFLKSTVREDYELINKVMTKSKEEMERSIAEIAKLLSIEELLDTHPSNLSGGEQQKVALGKILLLNPKILLLDEPTKGIDVFSRKIFQDILLKLKKQGITIIVVTHDIEFAATISDRCGLFFDKEIISMDTPVQFFSNNNFYTTVANRISRHLYPNAITCEHVIELCQMNKIEKAKLNI